MSMKTVEQIKQNQLRIIELTGQMSLWLGTPNAQKSVVRARIMELQDRTIHRLQELEIEGQRAKIENMEKVVALLKTGTETAKV